MQSKIFTNVIDALKVVPKNSKTVFTNGCFDIIHLGHLEYLKKSRNLGDFLIIGLNSDESIRNLKGNNRPFNDFQYRSEFLSYLDFVDMVIEFSESTPLDLIKTLNPHILTKGSDYKIDEVVGHDHVKSYGGDVVLINLKAGNSTSNIIKKIKSKY